MPTNHRPESALGKTGGNESRLNALPPAALFTPPEIGYDDQGVCLLLRRMPGTALGAA